MSAIYISPHTSRLKLSLAFLLFSFSFPTTGASDSDILIQVKNALLSDPDGRLRNWDPTRNTSPCNWTGIACNPTTLAVTSIDVTGLNISGGFPGVFCRIRTLRSLVLANNFFTGPISGDSISGCSQLHHLDLSSNIFIRDLPEFSPDFANLRTLNLSFNNFTGRIPASFGRFQKLETLSLYSNFFSGSIPAFLGNLTELRKFELAYNAFGGPLPPEIGNLTKLENMWLAGAGISGEIPHSIGNLVSLLNFDVSQNFLSGEIPPTLGNLKKVWQIELYANSLSGKLPESLANLTALRNFDASQNNLTGKVPDNVAGLPLISFHLNDNRLEGSIPESIALNPNLIGLKFFNNNFIGQLPTHLGTNSDLEEFDVSGNELTGELPRNLCLGGKLKRLITFQNSLSGTIPESYGSCSSLNYVRISDNDLTGEVPRKFWSHPKLTFLQLEGNRLQGSIPPNIGSALALQSLLVARNNFSGPLPEEMCNLDQLIVIDASTNNFSGEIPRCLTGLKNLQKLQLQQNMLTGEISAVGNSSWTALTELNLAGNKLSGRIPPQLGNLQELTYLGLDENRLTGAIPVDLTRLKLNFNFSFNNLEGKIPSGFNNKLFVNSLLGNPNLCGSDLNPIPPCDDPKPALIIAIIAIVAVLLLAFILWLVALRVKKLRTKIKCLWTMVTFHQPAGFTEDEIFNSLKEENLIGTGGSGQVYRVRLRSGKTVAVKKLWMGSNPDRELEIEEVFRSEAKMLGNVRHGNVVKLLCSGSSKEIRVLVYEYMENGSLGDALHGDQREGDGLFLTEWGKRLSIAVGAAQGLAYLHHDCAPPIVHRDVKSNNILLDEELRPRMADFGLAKILQREDGNGECSMSRIAGSYGYIAPEYGYTTRVNEKSDVYSFGVVLMELVTGKSPNDLFFHESNMEMVKWVTEAALLTQELNANDEASYSYTNLDQILDRGMDESTCNYEEIEKVIDIAILCTAANPTDRPSMRKVVELLKDCSSTRPR